MARKKRVSEFVMWGGFNIPSMRSLRGGLIKREAPVGYGLYKRFMFNMVSVDDKDIDVMFFDSKSAKTDTDRVSHALDIGFRPIIFKELERVRLLLNVNPALRRGFIEKVRWNRKEGSRSVIIMNALGSNLLDNHSKGVTHPQLVMNADRFHTGQFYMEKEAQLAGGVMIVTPLIRERKEATA